MRKQGYQLIAQHIAGHLHSADTHTLKQHREIERYALEGLAKSIADDLSSKDKRFKRDQFLKSCGIITSNEDSNLQEV